MLFVYLLQYLDVLSTYLLLIVLMVGDVLLANEMIACPCPSISISSSVSQKNLGSQGKVHPIMSAVCGGEMTC